MTPRCRCCGWETRSSWPRPAGVHSIWEIVAMFEMFQYDFMQNALLVGTVVAVVAAAVGYFVVLRGLSFAAHALAHVGFAGAAGAVLLGLSPLVGLLAFTLGGGIAMGLLGERLRGRDVAIGIVLAFALGLG